MSILANEARKKTPKGKTQRSSKVARQTSKIDANDIYVRRTIVHRAIRKLRLEERR